MTRLSTVERRKDRLELVRDAGHGRVSAPAVAGGVLSAFGALAVIVGVIVAIAEAVGVDARGFSHGDWRVAGLACAIATGVIACVAWALGGYVAGRMARRAGARHGLVVFVTSVVMLVVAAAIVWAEHGASTLRDALARQGAPTARGDWWDIAALAGLVSFVGALVGSMLGAVQGERWHQHLVERALDPAYGPEAEARAAADARGAAAAGRVDRTAPTAKAEPVDPDAEREWIQPARARDRGTVDLPEEEARETDVPARDDTAATPDDRIVPQDDGRLTSHRGGAWRER
ncbi:MAG TPA: YrzE family protein [Acidimicrobiia bacterium]|jgi:hypothetical protein